MKIQLVTTALSDIKSDALILPVFEEEKVGINNSLVEKFLKENPKFGKRFESQLIITPSQNLLLLGLGKKEKFNYITLQNWAGTAARLLLHKTKTISISLPQTTDLTPHQVGEAVAIGVDLASHDPAKEYKSKYENPKLTSVEVVVSRADRGYQDGLKQGLIISEGINFVRRLGDMPANEMTPTYFLNEVKRIARENKLKLTVLNEAQAKRKGMGAFVGVAQGSDEPSYMIVLEYTGNLRDKNKWGLVGKGITFDTGGLSLKPAGKMDEMKYDMCGAATVLSTMMVLAKLKVKANLVGVMAVTENFPGAKAQRPGDIVRTYVGKTAEVLNTDAEGRLVLIDALAYAQKDFKANKLIDLATLTGAMVIALGDNITGAFSNNPEFVNQIVKVGAEVGEKFWEMPMDEEFGEMIRGKFGDITNIGHGGSHPGAAGSITGAKFIQEGVIDDNPWIHLDIAGTAWDMKGRSYRSFGATGVGVKTLVQLINR